jgi:hypothetical protein
LFKVLLFEIPNSGKNFFAIKRRIYMKSLLPLCIFFFLFGTTCSWSQDENKKTIIVSPVENPSFEMNNIGLFLHWSSPLRVTKSGEYNIDTAEKHSGNTSYRIHSNTSEGWGYITGYKNEATEIKGGGFIKLRVWMKGKNLTDGFAWATLHWTLKDGSKGSMSVKSIGNNFEWKELTSKQIYLPENLDNYFVQVGVGPKFGGTVWIDDITVECEQDMVVERKMPEKTLVGYWNFDEGSGSTVHDQSGFGNDGIIKNPRWETGIKGKCLFIGDPDSYVEIPHSFGLSFRDNIFTLEAWVKPENIAGHKTILSKGNINFACYQGRLRKFMSDDYLGIGLKAKEWNHLVLTYDETIAKIYRNGLMCGAWSPGRVFFGSRQPLFIGWEGRYGCIYSGYIDEVKLYNRTLSAEEIRNNYAEIMGITAGEEIIYTPRETEMCRYVLYGLMKPDNINDTTGMPAYRKNLSLFVHNTTTKAMEIGKVAVNGESLEEIEKTDGNVAWHVIIPTVIPPYSYGEILIRCWDVDSLPMNTIDLTMWDMQGNVLDKGKVSIGKPGAAQFQSIGFQEDLREIYLYLRVDETLSIREIRCNGTRTKFRAGKTLTKHTINPIIVYPSISLEEGTHLFIEVVTNRGNNSVLTRVTQPFFPISIYRCFKYTQPNTAQAQTRYREMFGDYAEKYLTSLRKPGEKSVVPEWLDDCCDHYFNTFLGEPWVFSQNRNVQSSEEIVQLLKERKMRLGSLHEISKQGHAYEGLLYYGLADEPTGMERARKLIEKFNRIGKEAPRVPSSIVFCNLGSNPCDYTYVDRMLFDCYPIGSYAGKAPTSMGKKVKELAELIAPKPVGFVIQAFRANPTLIKKREYGWCRFPFPEEERLMVYDAIANGAKEISYFAYTIEPWEPIEGVGTAAMLELPDAVKLWDEIACINLELATLGPLLARGCVVKQEKQGDVEISHIAVGQDTFILVFVNTSYTYTKTGLITTPKSLNYQLQLSDSFTPGTVFEFTDSRFLDISFTHAKRASVLRIPDIETVKVLIVTEDATLKSTLRKRQKSLISKGT